IWNVLGIVLLIFLRPKLKIGQTFLLYLIYYSIGRFFIEGMRTDSLMILGVLRTAQVVSLSLIILGIVLWIYRNKNTIYHYTVTCTETLKHLTKRKRGNNV